MTRVTAIAPARPTTMPAATRHPLLQHHPHDRLPLRAERHAHAYVVGRLRHQIRHRAIDADHRQDQREDRECVQHDRREVLARQRIAHSLIVRTS